MFSQLLIYITISWIDTSNLRLEHRTIVNCYFARIWNCWCIISEINIWQSCTPFHDWAFLVGSRLSTKQQASHAIECNYSKAKISDWKRQSPTLLVTLVIVCSFVIVLFRSILEVFITLLVVLTLVVFFYIFVKLGVLSFLFFGPPLVSMTMRIVRTCSKARTFGVISVCLILLTLLTLLTFKIWSPWLNP